MGTPTGSLNDPARPIRTESREKLQAQRASVSDATHSFPIDFTMLDWTDQAPDATFDLHGQTVLEAAANAERFLRVQVKARPGAVVRLITGRGRAGGGAPVRTRVRVLLRELKESGRVVRDFTLEGTDGSYLVRLTG
jgi:DNA-nicking Smr family endonuclease